jgi:hypothetical protein
MSRESQIAAKRSRAEYPLDVPLLEHLHRCDRRLGFEERKRMMRDESLRGSPSRDGHRQRCKHHDMGPGLDLSHRNGGGSDRSQLFGKRLGQDERSQECEHLDVSGMAEGHPDQTQQQQDSRHRQHQPSKEGEADQPEQGDFEEADGAEIGRHPLPVSSACPD